MDRKVGPVCCKWPPKLWWVYEMLHPFSMSAVGQPKISRCRLGYAEPSVVRSQNEQPRSHWSKRVVHKHRNKWVLRKRQLCTAQYVMRSTDLSNRKSQCIGN